MSEKEPQPDIDLDALDEPGGMDAVLAEYRAGNTRGRKTRSPWISGLAVVLGSALMVLLARDLRYWMESEPRAVGVLSEATRDGGLDALDNRYVEVEGTPDLTHMVPIKRESGRRFVFLRMLDAGDRVFVFAPRDDMRTDEIQGRFTGRMQRADELESYDFLREAYALEDVREQSDVDPGRFAAWVADHGAGLESTQGVALQIRESDRVRIVARPPLSVVQLGARTWKSAEAAQAAIEALGRPFVALDGPETRGVEDEGSQSPAPTRFHRFLVGIADEEREQFEARLNEGVDQGNGAVPELGAAVLPRILSYSADPQAIAMDGDALVFPYVDNTADYGNSIDGGSIVARKLNDGALRVPLSEVEVVRHERLVRLTPEASVMVADETPADSQTNAILFFLVGAIVALNGAALIAGRRKRS